MSTAIKPVKKRNDDHVKGAKKKIAEAQKAESHKKVDAAKAAKTESNARSNLKKKLMEAPHYFVGVEAADRMNVIMVASSDVEMRKIMKTWNYDEPVLLESSEMLQALMITDSKNKEDARFWIAKWHVASGQFA